MRGQNDLFFSDYRRLQSYYNPAAIGLESDLRLSASYHRQWAGIKGAPANMLVSAHMGQTWGKTHHGLGMVVTGQKAGLFTRTEAAAQYAYQIHLKGERKLSIGIGAGMINLAYDGTKAFIPDGDGLTPNDPSLPQRIISGRTFDLSAGMLWHTPIYFLGLSGRHLTLPRIEMDQLYHQRVPIHINGVAGCNIRPRGALFTWHPSVFVSTNLTMWRVDVNVDMRIADRWEAGLLYRPLQAAGFRLGGDFGRLHAGYLFEMPTSQLAHGNWGSHELVLSYALPISSQKKGANSYKSIRLL